MRRARRRRALWPRSPLTRRQWTILGSHGCGKSCPPFPVQVMVASWPTARSSSVIGWQCGSFRLHQTHTRRGGTVRTTRIFMGAKELPACPKPTTAFGAQKVATAAKRAPCEKPTWKLVGFRDIPRRIGVWKSGLSLLFTDIHACTKTKYAVLTLYSVSTASCVDVRSVSAFTPLPSLNVPY